MAGGLWWRCVVLPLCLGVCVGYLSDNYKLEAATNYIEVNCAPGVPRPEAAVAVATASALALPAVARSTALGLPPFPKTLAASPAAAPVLSTNDRLITASTPAPAPNRGMVLLAWDRSPDASVVGYRVYFGDAPGRYTNSFAVGNKTNAAVRSLVGGFTNYYAVTAFDALGVESPFSNEAIFVAGVEGNLQQSVWSYSNPGTFGKTNEIVVSTDGLQTWQVLKTFVGDGLTFQTVYVTNTAAANLRVRIKGRP